MTEETLVVGQHFLVVKAQIHISAFLTLLVIMNVP